MFFIVLKNENMFFLVLCDQKNSLILDQKSLRFLFNPQHLCPTHSLLQFVFLIYFLYVYLEVQTFPNIHISCFLLGKGVTETSKWWLKSLLDFQIEKGNIHNSFPHWWQLPAHICSNLILLHHHGRKLQSLQWIFHWLWWPGEAILIISCKKETKGKVIKEEYILKM